MKSVRSFFTSKPLKKAIAPGNPSSTHSNAADSPLRGQKRERAVTPVEHARIGKDHSARNTQKQLKVEEMVEQEGAAAKLNSRLRSPSASMTAREHNDCIAQVFTLLSKAERAKGDSHRANSYAKGSATIAAHPDKILSGLEAKILPGIGKAIGDKIDEFLKTGTVSKLDKYLEDPEVKAMQDLQRISGVGPQLVLILNHRLLSIVCQF